MQDTGGERDDKAIVFAEHFAASDMFLALFREGMSLVEETAAYLDGLGRKESRALDRSGLLAYTTESMRLTTRLMHLASWLLMQRAINAGEISAEDIKTDPNKVRLEKTPLPSHFTREPDLPAKLLSLIQRSRRLEERLIHLDQAIYGRQTQESAGPNPIAADLTRLAKAFAPRGEG